MEAPAGWRCRPGGRLDMSHGFVRHIRRNQIARDAYERAVRQARGRARGRLTPTPSRPRRPDQQVYRPRRPVRGGRRPRHRCHRAPGGQRGGGGDTAGVRPEPAGARPAPSPLPAGAGRAQQAPRDGVTLPPPRDTAAPPGMGASRCLVSVKVL
ncbi:UPF0561 protein C2orf68 homolog isoform X2 [Rissa tridactyla]|uniref:UPF0561 protein C2orf68 homolog isoform X1 n=1 Tax=Rissa tridactyla TaxID=75485 RepID=UPI0023BAEB54|nr:UPF0561 protein C2orf68 homolog isoform X1 [Rissa tridactyla]XP_054036856.1 UPF0561 protein C2orf68 homolog isoform X2 [Rissa tridactyla]